MIPTTRPYWSTSGPPAAVLGSGEDPLTAIRFSMVDPPVTSTSRSSAVTEPEKTEAGASARAPTARTGLASRSVGDPAELREILRPASGTATAMSARPLMGSEPTTLPVILLAGHEAHLDAGRARHQRAVGDDVAVAVARLEEHTRAGRRAAGGGDLDLHHRGGDGVVDGGPVHAVRRGRRQRHGRGGAARPNAPRWSAARRPRVIMPTPEAATAPTSRGHDGDRPDPRADGCWAHPASWAAATDPAPSRPP